MRPTKPPSRGAICWVVTLIVSVFALLHLPKIKLTAKFVLKDVSLVDSVESITNPEHYSANAYSNSAIDYYHVTLMYPNVSLSSLCTVESLLRALLTQNESSPGVHVKPAVIMVWMNEPSQQPQFFRQMEQTVATSNSPRRVQVIRKKLNFSYEIKGTPLETFFANADSHKLGRYAKVNKADALRLALIYKYGGMYLDSDMLVLNDPSVLPDGIAKQAKHEFNGAVFRFRSPYHPLFSELFDDYVRSYNGQIWGWQGPQLFTRVLRRCNMTNALVDCKGNVFHIWDTKMVYPYGFTVAHKVAWSFEAFQEKYKVQMHNPSRTIMIHWWHKRSKGVETKICREGLASYKKSFLGRIKFEYCPKTTYAVLDIRKGEKDYCHF